MSPLRAFEPAQRQKLPRAAALRRKLAAVVFSRWTVSVEMVSRSDI